ncbi:MAG: hypothetical protein AB7O28_26540 [Vicinamibacterales bacterium]
MKVSTERREGYLYVRVTGDFSLDRAREACRAWSETDLARTGRCVICDVTELRSFAATAVPVMERFELGQAVVDALSPDIRLAIIETPEQFDPERFGETVMTNRGVMVHITTSLDDAMAWLAQWRQVSSTPVREGG